MLPKFLKNLNLNVKLNTVLLISYGILIIALVVARNTTFRTLFREISQQQLAQDTEILQQHFNDTVADILNSARLLSEAPGLVEAVETGDTLQVQTSILLQGASLQLNEINIINAEGDYLSTILTTDTGASDYAKDRLFSMGLNGIQTTEIISRKDAPGDLLLAGVVPVKNRAGVVIGAVLAGRTIDAAFMDALDFARPNTHIAFVYEGVVAAADHSNPEVFDNIEEDSVFIDQAARGQVYISAESRSDKNDSPDAIAFVPLRLDEGIQGVLVIRNDLDPLVAFQQKLTTSVFMVVGTVVVISLTMAILFIRSNITVPISRLKTVSHQIAGGDLTRRAPVHSQDEIGQMAQSFNEMADQVNGLVGKLEQRVVEAQEARARAERSEQVKSAFLASMSHELRTPLNAVINFTRFVIDGDTGPINNEQEELLTEVVGSAKHLLNLINDVLDMSKIEADSLNLFIEDNVNLNSLVENTVSTGRGLLANKPVRLETMIEENLPLISADRQRIFQVLLNIISNACKFTEEGEIKVSAYRKDDEIVISVADTGPGIAPEYHAAVFEAFKQVKSTLRQSGGTGLGMPIAKNLTEAHGGRLWLESEPGKGATFFVALPVKSEDTVPASALA
jgi:signal transduction histidine kinase